MDSCVPASAKALNALDLRCTAGRPKSPALLAGIQAR